MAENGAAGLAIKNEARLVALEYICGFLIRDAKKRGSAEDWDSLFGALNNMQFVNGKDEPMAEHQVQLAREGVRTALGRIETVLNRNG